MGQSMSNQAASVKNLTRGSNNFSVPMPPTFTDPVEEQRHVKQRLAAAYRIFALKGFDEGLAGHISVRDPIDKETFWVNPIGKHFGLMQVKDLVRVSHTGEILEGSSAINNAAFAIHSRIHAAKPHINAVAHSHTVHGRAFSALDQPLRPISQDACTFFEKHGVFSEFSGVISTLEEGDVIAETVGDGLAAILTNHGLLTVGKSVDACCANFVLLDSCCHSQLLAQAAGELVDIPDDIARKTSMISGSDLVTWGNFQPMYGKLVHDDDSFLAED